MFTYHYHQPEEYRCSLDSIQLALFVADQLRNRHDLNLLRVLDLCAGSGVIGMELTWHLPELRHIEFMDVQAVYTDYFYKNVALINRPELQLHWHLANYDCLIEDQWTNQFDLIVSNPPYFHQGHGVLSPSEFKNRCRFFIDSTFDNFIKALANSLTVGGEAYFLLRPLKQHGYDLLGDIRNLLRDTPLILNNIANIRGNEVIFLKKMLS
ncbi:N5-glutamine S-adenosyl-L-methionine-dependent methyltransferase [Legionella moravica]|uniref:N5-glutamine S-adenosyl-L-methionine-dependent methyltransferase n=1 Tax=Legionella moravica TaxID=39962 RepID=A0A378JYA4_9GAMM|nr:methyltransferase [Legionella moravica]KTD38322.1 N5-glutamine S-adenosyl-L-methionine-dependent methyltransferase [Legionella moravica]STX63675.1 N5-glutamine S-adenosyl-L-methionine-dependent methyltransferase [Legionella moravica]